MDKLKQWVALTVVGVLVILAAGWFLLVSPKRGEAAEVRLQADQKASENSTLSNKITMLKAQAKELPKQQARLAAVAAKIPDNPALPALIRALTAAADDAGVELASLAPSTPTAVAAAPASAAVVAAPGTAAAPSTTPAGASATGASSVAGTAGTLQAITLQINVVGGYFQIEQFFDKVENLSRAMKVGSLTLAPGSNPVRPAAQGTTTSDPGRVLAANITGTVYMATGRTTTVGGK